MEITHLTETQPYAEFFRHSVLEDIPYWECYLKDNATDNAALQYKREQIIKNIQVALDLERAWQTLQTLIPALSPYMERWGYWKQWQETLEYALQVAHHHQDKVGEVSLSVLLARLLFQQSRYREAIIAYRQTIRMACQIGDPFNQARAYTNLGYHYIEQGQWYRAEVLCCHALKIFEQIDSAHGRAHTDNHLGILYTKLHQWDQAQHHLEQACAIWQATGDEHGLMRGFLNLGSLYIYSNRPDEALAYFKKTLHLAELTGDEITIGRIYLNMGLAHIMGENFTQAETYVQLAETIFRQYANTAELARAWDSLAVIHFRRGKCAEAILLSENSLKIWQHLKNTEDGINTLMDLIEYELGRGNRQQAALRLDEVEQLIGPLENTLYRHHLPRLVEISRSLTEQTPQQAATD